MSAVFVKSLTNLEDLPQNDKVQVAMVGRSNVGKSSLINQLTQQKALANVSSQPGRTQTINVFDVDNRWYLVDLPGYGFTKGSVSQREGFSEMIGDYLLKTSQLKLVVMIVDASIPPTILDLDMFAYLRSISLNVIVVMNKIDKLSQSQLAALKPLAEKNFPGAPTIPHSSLTSKGRGEILEAINTVVRNFEVQ